MRCTVYCAVCGVQCAVYFTVHGVRCAVCGVCGSYAPALKADALTWTITTVTHRWLHHHCESPKVRTPTQKATTPIQAVGWTGCTTATEPTYLLARLESLQNRTSAYGKTAITTGMVCLPLQTVRRLKERG